MFTFALYPTPKDIVKWYPIGCYTVMRQKQHGGTLVLCVCAGANAAWTAGIRQTWPSACNVHVAYTHTQRRARTRSLHTSTRIMWLRTIRAGACVSAGDDRLPHCYGYGDVGPFVGMFVRVFSSLSHLSLTHSYSVSLVSFFPHTLPARRRVEYNTI